MTIREGMLVSPGDSITYYGTATNRTFGIASLQTEFNANIRALQVRELARGLGASAVIAGEISQQEYANRAYEYVRQNLKTIFAFGQQKGSLGALLDQAGTSFDQSSLLVDLLREAQITANYQLGTITLSNTAADPTTGQPRNEIAAWAGITDPTAACKLLADGGIPGEINGSTNAGCTGYSGTISALKMRHMWVTANVRRADGVVVTSQFDPTFKRNTWSGGIDLAAAMGCGSACGVNLRGLLPTTTLIGGAPAYTNIDSVALESGFKNYAIALLNNLRGRTPSLQIQDAAGGPSIDLASMTTPAATLPYPTELVTTLTAIPNQYRIRFNIQFASINKEVFSDELAGKRLRVLGDVAPDNANHTATALNIVLYAEYEIVASNNSAMASPGTNPLTLTINHPYAATSGTYSDTSTRFDTYSLEGDDESNASASIRFRFNPFTIVTAFGSAGAGTAALFGDLQAKNMYRLDVTDKTNPAHTWARCIPYPAGGPLDLHVDEGNTYRYGCLRLEQPSFGATWLHQNERMLDLVGRVNKSEVTTHHIAGYAISGVYWAPSLNVSSGLSISSRANSAADRQSASFTASSMSARLEGSAAEQSAANSLGMSAPSMIDMANKKGISLIAATQSNFDAMRSSLIGWPSSLLDQIRSAYIINGYTVLLPRTWSLGFYPFTPGSSSGITINFGGYFAYRPNGERSAYLVADGNKGAAPVGPLDPSNELLATLKQVDASLKARNFHSVDLKNGALNLKPPPDLVSGNGEFPFSLMFQRSYSSAEPGLPQSVNQRETRRGLFVHPWEVGSQLRYGWKHNLDIRGRIVSNYERATGSRSAADAANVLATIAILRDLHLGSSSFANEVTSTFAANWWGKTLVNNGFNFIQGDSEESFLRMADGSFSDEKGDGKRLTTTVSDYYKWYVRPLHHYLGTWELTNTDGSTIQFVQDGSYVPSPGEPLYEEEILRRTFYPTRWSFPTGVYIDFEYLKTNATGDGRFQWCLNEVRNNLGRRIRFNFATTIRQIEGYCVVDNVQDENGRTVSFSDSVEGGNQLTFNPPDHTFTVSLPDGNSVAYRYRSTTDDAGPVSRAVNVIESWSYPTDTSAPYAQVAYDDLFRVREISLAPNNAAGTRSVTRYSIGAISAGENLRRGELRDGTGGRSTSYYGKAGQPLQTIDGLGRVTTNIYDSRDRLYRSISPEGNASEYEYDARNNSTRVTSRPKPGSALPATFQVTEYAEGVNVANCSNFTRCNKVVAVIDLRGNRTTYDYNGLGQLTDQIAPTINGEVPRTKYCYSTISGVSMMTGRIQAVGTTVPKPDRVTRFEYNNSNHLALYRVVVDPIDSLTNACAATSKPLGKNLTTTFTFDGIGNIRTVDGPRADPDIATYTFDPMRRLKQVDKQFESNPAYARTIHEYYSDGTLRQKQRWDGSVLRIEDRTYWPSGDLRRVTDAEGNTTDYVYDLAGRVALKIDGEGRGMGKVFDAAGQTQCEWRGIRTGVAPQSCVWNPAGYAGSGPFRYSSFEYALNGKPRRVTDGNNNATEFFYDNQDRLKYTFLPNASDGTRCTLSLPTVASMDTAVPACALSNNRTPTYEALEYTVDGTVSGERCGGLSQVCRKCNRSGNFTSMTYDALNRMSTRTATGIPTVTYAYNLVNELRSATSPSGSVNSVAVPAHSTAYEYDDAGRRLHEDNLIGNWTRRVTYAHDEASNLSRVTWPDNYYVTYEYDELNRIEYVRENSSTANELARYRYDELSRLRELRFAGVETNKVTYTYEPDNNLDLLTNYLGSAMPVFDHTYNRAGQLRGVTSSDNFYLPSPATRAQGYIPNALNQYARVDNVSTSYDTNGNLLNWGSGSTVRIYTYDSENRLRSSRIGTGPITRYDYDATDRRISKDVGGTFTYFLSAGENEIAEYTAAGTLLRRFINGGTVDERIAMASGSATTAPPKAYYHVNHQRSVIAMSDANGNTSGCGTGVDCQRLNYDEYGNPGAGTEDIGQPFRYTGRRFDPESGLYYFRARYYTPTLGRFLQSDPIGYEDNVNAYAYTNNDPLNHSDPTGKCGLSDVFAGPSALSCAMLLAEIERKKQEAERKKREQEQQREALRKSLGLKAFASAAMGTGYKAQMTIDAQTAEDKTVEVEHGPFKMIGGRAEAGIAVAVTIGPKDIGDVKFQFSTKYIGGIDLEAGSEGVNAELSVGLQFGRGLELFRQGSALNDTTMGASVSQRVDTTPLDKYFEGMASARAANPYLYEGM